MDLKQVDRKIIYFFAGCLCFALLIIGATYAYFAANVTDYNTVMGDANTVTFGLTVERVTTVDMAYGLVPMKNIQAPSAAQNGCRDTFGNAGCQMYKITITSDSDLVMFLDGYIVMTPKDERLETRFTRIYTEDGEKFNTKFTLDEYKASDFDEDKFIKNGIRVSNPETVLNHEEDYGCLLIENEMIGGSAGRVREFYVMIWVYDNGQAQDYLQGMQLAYKGDVIFITAQGNEIKATFD